MMPPVAAAVVATIKEYEARWQRYRNRDQQQHDSQETHSTPPWTLVRSTSSASGVPVKSMRTAC